MEEFGHFCTKNYNLYEVNTCEKILKALLNKQKNAMMKTVFCYVTRALSSMNQLMNCKT